MLGAGAGDRTEVVDQVGLGHANTRVTDGQDLVLLVGDDVDEELRLGVELGLVRQGLIADLVESIGGVGDELTQEDLLVGVEGVDDEAHQLADFSLECKCFLGHDAGVMLLVV